ncbi:chemotaxis protein CheB [Bordetella bronchialis]|uniref:chemotaxis protein CheB n=1 Tax=Bordetella bronchialis TaxID=463025 RepID=UPI003D01271C
MLEPAAAFFYVRVERRLGSGRPAQQLLPILIRARDRVMHNDYDGVPAPKDDAMSSYLTDRCIAIGASWGGVTAIMRLVAELPADIPVPVFIVQHIGAHASQLDALIDRQGPNPAKFPAHGERIQAGTIYVAPPDRHMLVDKDTIMLDPGPKENHARPSIDPLFRSVALAYRERAAGVILTGMLDDGTAGLKAIKDCGGIAVVQDPADAEQADMPRSAIANVEVDHIVPLAGMGALLGTLAQSRPGGQTVNVPDHVRREHAMTLGQSIIENLTTIAHPSALTCPDCGGALFELNDTRPMRYRCHVGHAFTLESLANVQADTAEVFLWAALRSLTEKSLIIRRMAEALPHGDTAQAEQALREADRLSAVCEQLRGLVQKST